jgi:hypothetical protein
MKLQFDTEKTDYSIFLTKFILKFKFIKTFDKYFLHSMLKNYINLNISASINGGSQIL